VSAKAEIEIDFSEKTLAKVVYRALSPELQGRGEIACSGSRILLDISARNPSELRAMLNSLLRWVKMIEEVIRIG